MVEVWEDGSGAWSTEASLTCGRTGAGAGVVLGLGAGAVGEPQAA